MRPADRVDRALAGLALVAPVLYLLLMIITPHPGTHPGDVILKASMCSLLALLAWRRSKYVFACALVFSAVGDALLCVDGARLFLPALASFLVTHLLYAVLFGSGAKLQISRLRVWRWLLLLLVPLFVLGFAALLWPNVGELALPIACYIAAIAAMAVLSLRVPATVVPIGAVLFMASDSLLALDRFLWRAPWIGLAVWITYAAAQLLIAYGLLSAVVTKQ